MHQKVRTFAFEETPCPKNVHTGQTTLPPECRRSLWMAPKQKIDSVNLFFTYFFSEKLELTKTGLYRAIAQYLSVIADIELILCLRCYYNFLRFSHFKCDKNKLDFT